MWSLISLSPVWFYYLLTQRPCSAGTLPVLPAMWKDILQFSVSPVVVFSTTEYHIIPEKSNVSVISLDDDFQVLKNYKTVQGSWFESSSGLFVCSLPLTCVFANVVKVSVQLVLGCFSMTTSHWLCVILWITCVDTCSHVVTWYVFR